MAVLYAPGIYLQIIGMNAGMLGILLLPLTSIVLALIMSTTGTTLGKAIVGVRVRRSPNINPIVFYIVREFKVWVFGMGFGIPFITVFTHIKQYNKIKESHKASYDQDIYTVFAKPSPLRLCIGIFIAIILLIGEIYIGTKGQNYGANIYATQDWINPITSLTAHIDKGWQSKEMATNSGRAFYFASPDALADAIFGYEQIFTDGMDNLTYANAIQRVVASSVSITSEWKPVKVNGITALRASGRCALVSDCNVELTVAVKAKNAWRTIVSARGRPIENLPNKEAFVSELFATTR